MTKELKQEAEEYAEKSKPNFVVNEYGSTVYTRLDIEQAFLAGAEPREKRIAELEETNTDLKQSLDWANERESEDVKRIAELEKENVKLKEKNKWYSEQVCNKECAEVWGQLTKAKKIIKTMLSSKTDFDERRFALWAWKEEVNKAEQFLSEVENG